MDIWILAPQAKKISWTKYMDFVIFEIIFHGLVYYVMVLLKLITVAVRKKIHTTYLFWKKHMIGVNY